jgi:4-amino-4-deoxy-L-arabinose transferase-like glycosyltransferase
VAFAVRTLIAFLVPILPDEAYYWQWSRHLQAGYFDHPPGIALLIAAGTAIFGDNAFGVRFGAAVAALVAHVAITLLAGRLGGARAAARAACLAALLPLATLGLVLATPDAPLLAATAAALLFLERALAAPPRSKASTAWWTATGMALGVAFLSKYTAVLLPMSLVIACVAYKPLRARLAEPGPWLASFVALFLFLPVVAWNALSDWVSFRFQLNHGLGHAARGTPLSRELALVGGQLGLATPILGVMLTLAVVLAWRSEWRARLSTRATDLGVARFALAMAALVPMAFFAVSAWRSSVEANWPALFYPAAMVLLASSSSAWAWGRWWKSGVVLAVVVLALLVAQVWQPMAPLPPRRDPIARAYGWTTLAAAVNAARHDAFLGDRKQWVAADRYQDASELAFHLPDQPEVFSLNLNGRTNQYDFWDTPSDVIRPTDGMVATFDANAVGDSLAQVVGQWFGETRRGETVQLRRKDGVVSERRVWLYRDAHDVPAPSVRLPATASHR